MADRRSAQPWNGPALILVVALHAALLLALREWSRPHATVQPRGEPIRIQWLVIEPPAPPPVPPAIRSPRESESLPAPPVRPVRRVLAPTAVAETPPAERPVLVERALRERLYRPDGSLALSEDLLLEVDRNTIRRDFDFQIAGLEHAGKVFDRPPPLVYQATRFDGYWQPTPDVLTDVLERAVRASTATVRIPIPGRPGWRLVCSVVVLAVSGGCGMAGPNNPVLGLDDPDTLDADEQRACESLWQQIAEARSQAERHRLTGIYETGCRKPSADL